MAKTQDAKIAKGMAALGHVNRVRIVRALQSQGEPLSAGDLAKGLQISPTLLSAHLRTLTEAGLIVREQRGRMAFFALDQVQLSLLSHFLE